MITYLLFYEYIIYKNYIFTIHHNDNDIRIIITIILMSGYSPTHKYKNLQ